MPAEALHEADLVLVSALAVGRDGTRLGMGNGSPFMAAPKPCRNIQLSFSSNDWWDSEQTELISSIRKGFGIFAIGI